LSDFSSDRKNVNKQKNVDHAGSWLRGRGGGKRKHIGETETDTGKYR